ncbi:hypothetical protein ACFL6O_01240 [candidate division KSB1 bacterium]
MKLILYPILIIGIIVYGGQMIDLVDRVRFLNGEMLWLSAGVIISLILCLMTHRSKSGVTFWHELTHMFWAKLFKGKMVSMYISPKGGYVHHRGALGAGQTLIALAPYFFPLVTVGLLLIRAIVKPGYTPYFSAAIGFSLAGFYYDMIKSIMIPQSDIKGQGVLYSTIVIVFFNILFLGIIIASVSHDVTVMQFLKAERLFALIK